MVLEKTLESPLDCKEIQAVSPKGNHSWIFIGSMNAEVWCWSWNSSTLATGCKELTHWRRPWCWERLKVRGEGGDRGWEGWMASPPWWTWVWANSQNWWWIGYSCLENPMDGGAWWAAVHGVAKSQTPLSNFTFTFHFHALEKEMATHSSVRDLRILGRGSLVGCRLWGCTESDTTQVI